MIQILADLVASFLGYKRSKEYDSIITEIHNKFYSKIKEVLEKRYPEPLPEGISSKSLRHTIDNLTDPALNDMVCVKNFRPYVYRYGLLWLMYCLYYKILIYNVIKDKLVLDREIIEIIEELEKKIEETKKFVKDICDFVKNEENIRYSLSLKTNTLDREKEFKRYVNKLVLPLEILKNQYYTLLERLEKKLTIKADNFYRSELLGYIEILEKKLNEISKKIKAHKNEFNRYGYSVEYLLEQHENCKQMLEELFKTKVLPFFSMENELIMNRIVEDIYEFAISKVNLSYEPQRQRAVQLLSNLRR